MQHRTKLSPNLSPAVRYTAAWAEISARLTVRAQISVSHITAILAAITAYFAIQVSSTEKSLDIHYIPEIVMLIISTIFVSWYAHTDIIIGLLSAFCKELEKNDLDDKKYRGPSWFFGPEQIDKDSPYQRIMTAALDQRKLSDFSTTMICFASPILIIWNETTKISYANSALLIVSIIWLYFICAYIWSIDKTRRAILEGFKITDFNNYLKDKIVDFW